MQDLFFIETSLRDAITVNNLIYDMFREGSDFKQTSSNSYEFFNQDEWEDFTSICQNLKLEVWATIEDENGLILN